MGKAVYQAACDGNEAELRRLIRLGGSVNCHIPEVRLRMPRVVVAACTLRPRGSAAFAQASCTRRVAPMASPPPRRHAAPRTCVLDVRRASLRSPSSNYRSLFLTRCFALRSQDCDSTALMVGSAYGREGCVQLLLDSGATVNDTNVSAELPRCPVAPLFAYVCPMHLPVISLCITL